MHGFVARDLMFKAGLSSLLFAFSQAWAGDFSVNPIRIEFGPGIRSSVVSVRNEGKEKMGFQVEAMEWTQDAAGADQYANSRDLVFFPKILSVEPGEEGLIRVGVKAPVVPVEKTYRLFIQELPSPAQAALADGPRVNLLLRFGAPVFVAPVKATDSAEVSEVRLARGVLGLSVKNTGNRHQVVQGIQVKGTDAQGSEVYASTLADRYLLAGTAKSYTASIPAEKCQLIKVLKLDFKTDRLGVTRSLDVNPAMCS